MGDHHGATGHVHNATENVTAAFNAALNEIIFNGTVYKHSEDCEEPVVPGSGEFWMYLCLTMVAIVFAGLMSGLTVGLMSFDEKNLSILMTQSKDPKQRYRARRVHNMIKDHHLLLVTLLLWNAAAFESLPIFLDRLVPAYLAVILSVTFILIFGEIVPQALCTGPNRLAIGAASYWLVKVLQTVIFPLAWPIGKVLDRVLGTREERDSMFLYLPREQLGLPPNGENAMALIELHGEVEGGDAESGGGSGGEGAPAVATAASKSSSTSNGGSSNSSGSRTSRRKDVREMDEMPDVLGSGSDA